MITNYLLVSILLVSIISFQKQEWQSRLILNPYVIQQRKEWYRFISSGFIHADWIHLLVNVFVLFSFGAVVESYFRLNFGESSHFYFLLLYFGGMITAVLPSYSKNKNNPAYNSLGASGAVSAVVFSFILFDPLQKLCLYGLLCLPGIIFGVAYLFYCYYMAKKGGDNINHDAHLWGALFGFFFTVLLKPSLLMEFVHQLINSGNAF